MALHLLNNKDYYRMSMPLPLLLKRKQQFLRYNLQEYYFLQRFLLQQAGRTMLKS